MFGFGKKASKRSPAELVKLSVELLRTEAAAAPATGSSAENASAQVEGTPPSKAMEELSKAMSAIKLLLTGEEGGEPSPEAVTQLSNAVLKSGLLQLMTNHLSCFEFEARKDTAHVFSMLLRRQVGAQFPTVDYIAGNPEVLFGLVRGYEELDLAANTGLMLRECIRHESLARILLESEYFWRFFQYVEYDNFDVSSDAFASFKDLLTKHKTLCAAFIEANYDKIMPLYTALLKSENYVTKRQSLKLLGELLLDRANYATMTRYIAEPSNLKLMMTLLKDTSKSIQFESFHCFKIFVANPNKGPQIVKILYKNKDKLVSYLSTFHADKDGDDEQFMEEKSLLSREIGSLEAPPAA